MNERRVSADFLKMTLDDLIDQDGGDLLILDAFQSTVAHQHRLLPVGSDRTQADIARELYEDLRSAGLAGRSLGVIGAECQEGYKLDGIDTSPLRPTTLNVHTLKQTMDDCIADRDGLGVLASFERALIIRQSEEPSKTEAEHAQRIYEELLAEGLSGKALAVVTRGMKDYKIQDSDRSELASSAPEILHG